MKYKASLISLLFFILSYTVSAQVGDCNCTQCDPTPGVTCSITGDYGFTAYYDAQACFETEPSCGGIPLNTNSWTLLLVGSGMVAAGIFISSRLTKQ